MNPAVPGRRLVCCIMLACLLALCACGGGGETASYIGFGASEPDLSDVTAYRPAGPYAGVLKECALAADEAGLCSMETLPLIGQDAPAPSVADVMDRVLVSHAWMGARFEEVLNLLPADLLTLFKGVTVIVIDDTIRPSFYSSGTAAIYLDPANLWLSNAEKATIAKLSDFRSGFGAELQFVGLWRYVKNSDYAYFYYSLNGSETRQISDILYPMASLLYHELAHANDFLPPARQPALDRQLSPYAAMAGLGDDDVSAHLEASLPLTSTLWGDLGQVLFQGEPASATQQHYTAAWVGHDFADDGANDAYNYAAIREDVAMLFEETMMKYHFDVDRDIAFTDPPLNAAPSCDDYIVQWGSRNRLGVATVRPRAALVAGELLPATDLSAFFAGFPAATPMTPNLGWCSNLSLGAVAPLGLAPQREVPAGQLRQDRLPPDAQAR